MRWILLFFLSSSVLFAHGDGARSAEELRLILKTLSKHMLADGRLPASDSPQGSSELEAFYKLNGAYLEASKDPSSHVLLNALDELNLLLNEEDEPEETVYKIGRFLHEDFYFTPDRALNRAINDRWAFVLHAPLWQSVRKFIQQSPLGLLKLSGASAGLLKRFGPVTLLIVAATQVSWEAVETVISWSLGLGGMHAACTAFNIALLSTTHSLVAAIEGARSAPPGSGAWKRLHVSRRVWWNTLAAGFLLKRAYRLNETEGKKRLKKKDLLKAFHEADLEFSEVLVEEGFAAAAAHKAQKHFAQATLIETLKDGALSAGQKTIVIENWFRMRSFLLREAEALSYASRFPEKAENFKAALGEWSRLRLIWAYWKERSEFGRLRRDFDQLRTKFLAFHFAGAFGESREGAASKKNAPSLEQQEEMRVEEKEIFVRIEALDHKLYELFKKGNCSSKL